MRAIAAYGYFTLADLCIGMNDHTQYGTYISRCTLIKNNNNNTMIVMTIYLK